MLAARIWDSLMVCADADTDERRINQKDDALIRNERTKILVNNFHPGEINPP